MNRKVTPGKFRGPRIRFCPGEVRVRGLVKTPKNFAKIRCKNFEKGTIFGLDHQPRKILG